jgi:hypothetical protein
VNWNFGGQGAARRAPGRPLHLVTTWSLLPATELESANSNEIQKAKSADERAPAFFSAFLYSLSGVKLSVLKTLAIATAPDLLCKTWWKSFL